MKGPTLFAEKKKGEYFRMSSAEMFSQHAEH